MHCNNYFYFFSSERLYIFEVFSFALRYRVLHGPNQCPEIPLFRSTMEAYFSEVCLLGQSLLPIFVTSFGLESNYFKSFQSNPFIIWRIMRYPPGVRTVEQFGTAPHTDSGTFTLLAQDDSGGLQLCLRDGQWISASVVKDAFAVNVNVGDLMACWTNVRFISTPHQVVNNSDSDRYSIPLVFNSSFDTVAKCLPTCQSENNPSKYELIHYGDYLTKIYDGIFVPLDR